MGVNNQNFTMTSGDDQDVDITVTDGTNAVDLTGASATWAFGRQGEHGDGPAIATKTVGSGITFTDAPNGQLRIRLDQADTANEVGDYWHELQVVDNGGSKSTPTKGTMTVEHDRITT